MNKHFRISILPPIIGGFIFMLFAGAFIEDVEAGETDNRQALHGRVMASSGEALSGAVIRIEELDEVTTSDSDGYFLFPSLESGSYTLSVNLIGYISKQRVIEHPGSEPVVIELEMSIIRMGDVVVTSSPLERDSRFQSSQIIGRRELQEQSSMSVGEMLDGSPGVHMQSFGSAPSRPVIRGLGGDRLLILQNGERMGDFSATSHDHAIAIDPLLIERVEVVRGPASLLYGSSALGGVVNLFTDELKFDALESGRAEGFRGSLMTHGATVNRLGNSMGKFRYSSEQWMGSGHLNIRRGKNLRTPKGKLPGTWSSGYSMGTGFGYRNETLQSGHAISWLEHNYGIPDHLDEPDESMEIRSDRFSWQSRTSLERPGRFFSEAEVRTALNVYDLTDLEVEHAMDGESEETVEKRMKQQSLSTTLTLQHQPFSLLEGAMGLNLRYRNLDVSGEQILTPDAGNFNLGAFLYEEIRLNRFTMFQFGGRLDLQQMQLKENLLFDHESIANVERNDAAFSGSAGLNVRPNSRWEMGFQIARAFRMPTLEELYSDAPHQHAGAYQIGNSDLGSELNLGTDLFIRYSDSRFGIELAGYINRVDNFIMLSPTGAVDPSSNLPVYTYEAADAMLAGFEFYTEYRLTQELRTRFETDFVHGSRRDGEWTPLPFMPPLRAGVTIQYEKPEWWSGVRLRTVNRQSRVAPLEEETNGYLLMGLSVGWRLGRGAVLSVRIDNLLNTSYRDHLTRIEDRDHPMPARNLNAALRWDF